MSKRKSKFISSSIKLLTAALLFLKFQPYFLWEFSGTLLLLAVTLPLVLILMTHARGGKEVTAAVIFGIIAFLGALTEGNNVFGLLVKIMVVVLFLCTSYLQEVYKYFKILYVILIGISAAVWVMVLCGVPLPMNEIMPLNSLKEIYYNQYPFLVMLGYDPEESIFRAFRFCGFFDEPGVVGTNALLMLLIERFNLRKPSNVVLLISGLISMSLFFYVGSFLYILYSFTLTEGNVRAKVVAILCFVVVAIFTYNFEVTHAAIWERLEYDESKGSFAGNNRSDEDLKRYIDRIRWTDAYWLGVQDKEVIEKYSGSASVQNAVLKYGIIGCILYVSFFVFYIFKRIPRRKDALFCLLFLLITLWQRPDMYSIQYVFLYLIFIHNFGKRQVAIAQ